MSDKEQSRKPPDGELLPPREVMSLIDPTAAGGSGVPGASGLLGGAGSAAPDPTHAAGAPDASQAAAPAHGLSDDALKQAQATPGTSDPHVESTAKS
jgi:hypothetical protein